MNMIVLAGAAAVVIWLIVRSLSKRNMPAEECAKAVIELLRKNQNASAQEIAEVYENHNRSRADIEEVTPLIKARLNQARIRKEDQPELMQRVRQAKDLIKG